jgi:hypothetical protein
VVVAADNVAQCGQSLFYALDLHRVWEGVAQVLQFLVCGGGRDEETFAVTIFVLILHIPQPYHVDHE